MIAVPRPRAAFAAALLLLIAAPRLAEPCSICRCGDPTFNALGKEGYAAQGWRLALDWERFDKQEGDPALEAETLVENRVTALASYGFGERYTLYARLPLSFRNFQTSAGEEPGDSFNTSGLSDPELYGQVRVWGSRFSGAFGHRTTVSLLAGIKLPVGQNEFERDGERVDEHAQPGTGSTDLFGGLALLHLIDKRSAFFSSVQYRHTGTNDFDYQYGATWLANVAYERKLAGRVDGVVELNFRHAGKDEGRDEDDPAEIVAFENTGGSLIYFTPRLLVDAGHGVVFRGALQVPLIHDLNGFQEERVVVNVGVSYLVGRR